MTLTQHSRRSLRRFLLAFPLTAAFWLALPGQLTAAEQPLSLTPELKVQLAALGVLRGANFEPSELNAKAVLVSFFASWCVPCRKSFVEQRRLLERVGGNKLKIIAINWFEDASRYPGESMRLTRLLDRISPGITALDGDNAVYEAFGRFRGLPALFVFDQTGSEIYRFMYRGGAGNVNADYQEIGDIIDALLEDTNN